MMSLPPRDGCPEGTIGCTDGRCPYTCFCEDHCSWKKCALEEAPDHCLSHVNSRWTWNSKEMFWVATINGNDYILERITIYQIILAALSYNLDKNVFIFKLDGFTKVADSGCSANSYNSLARGNLQIALSSCAYDKQCSGVYHSCCDNNCVPTTLTADDEFEDAPLIGYIFMPHLQLCPMQTIENATFDEYNSKYRQCTYQKQNHFGKFSKS